MDADNNHGGVYSYGLQRSNLDTMMNVVLLTTNLMVLITRDLGNQHVTVIHINVVTCDVRLL